MELLESKNLFIYSNLFLRFFKLFAEGMFPLFVCVCRSKSILKLALYLTFTAFYRFIQLKKHFMTCVDDLRRRQSRSKRKLSKAELLHTPLPVSLDPASIERETLRKPVSGPPRLLSLGNFIMTARRARSQI